MRRQAVADAEEPCCPQSMEGGPCREVHVDVLLLRTCEAANERRDRSQVPGPLLGSPPPGLPKIPHATQGMPGTEPQERSQLLREPVVLHVARPQPARDDPLG